VISWKNRLKALRGNDISTRQRRFGGKTPKPVRGGCGKEFAGLFSCQSARRIGRKAKVEFSSFMVPGILDRASGRRCVWRGAKHDARDARPPWDFNTFLTLSRRFLISSASRACGILPLFEAHGAPESFMNDLIFIAVMIAFFALAALYARFCEKIQE